MKTIEQVFADCKAARRAAFIPYITAGDPDLESSLEMTGALVAGGADIIELGVPFSDPIADGAVNQRAAKRALDAGTTLDGVLQLVGRAKERHDVPIVLFTYFNPMFSRGLGHFARQAAASGVDGILCLDLPPEEASRGYLDAMRDVGIRTIFLVAPTSTKARIRQVNEVAEGFVYYVSRTGVTGRKTEIEAGLVKEVKRVRRAVELPLAVGFGISSPDQVAEVGKYADGVVVGSALVSIVEEHGSEAADPLESRVRELVEPLHAVKKGWSLR